METQATPAPEPFVRWKRAVENKSFHLVRHSHCGLWKVTKREWEIPYCHTTYELALLDAEGNTLYEDKECETLGDAKEAAEEIMKNPHEFFDENSPQARRINARRGEILDAAIRKGGAMK